MKPKTPTNDEIFNSIVNIVTNDIITHRINQAVILAKEDLAKGVDLRPIMLKLIEQENYSGAEGIRRVLENEC